MHRGRRSSSSGTSPVAAAIAACAFASHRTAAPLEKMLLSANDRRCFALRLNTARRRQCSQLLRSRNCRKNGIARHFVHATASRFHSA